MVQVDNNGNVVQKLTDGKIVVAKSHIQGLGLKANGK
jgi:hypothetical protein